MSWGREALLICKKEVQANDRVAGFRHHLGAGKLCLNFVEIVYSKKTTVMAINKF